MTKRMSRSFTMSGASAKVSNSSGGRPSLSIPVSTCMSQGKGASAQKDFQCVRSPRLPKTGTNSCSR